MLQGALLKCSVLKISDRFLSMTIKMRLINDNLFPERDNVQTSQFVIMSGTYFSLLYRLKFMDCFVIESSGFVRVI